MKRNKRELLFVALILLMIMSLATTAAAAEQPPDTTAVKAEPFKNLFTDVKSTDNNALFINYLADLKIISGYPDGSFKAQEGLTRAQAAVILVKAAGLSTPAESTNSFADVKSDHWAATSIAAAAQAGYLKGYPGGSFKPEEKLTRAQGISLVLRLSKQEKKDELPTLKDMPQNHWAAADMATALNAGMISLSEDKTLVYPEAIMTRGSLAGALGTLLVKDPGLYTKTLTGTIKEIKGEIKLTRNGTTTTLQNGASIYKGDSITTGANSTANLVYPDGSSVLIEEKTELYIKESLGRACIKENGTGGIAVDNVDIELKKGTLFGALATKHENTPEKQQAQNGETLLASMNGLGYLADNNTPPWYQQAEAKKVKMKVDMPYGVAAIRGTYLMVTLTQDENGNITGCDVICLTGDATVQGNNDQTGQNLTGGTSTSINNVGNAANAGTLTEEEKKKLAQAAVQQWVVNTALNMNNNKEAKVQMVVEVPDNTANPEQSALDVVLKALQDSGITLDENVKTELEQKINETLETVTPTTSSGGGTTEESSVSYINYATAGTYGPENDVQTISKNVIVSAPGITLKNMVITRDLILGAGIGDGNVTLENVKVQGNTSVLGGGSDSVTLVNCDLYTVTVDKDEVRIVAKGTSKIGALTLNTGATLEETDLTGDGFSSVSTGLTLPAGARITLSGNFEAVNINAPDLTIELASGSIENIILDSSASGTELTLASGTSVNTMIINAQANIGGAGTIASATINASNVVMAQTPSTIIVSSGVDNASVGGQQVSEGSTQIVSTIEISGAASISIPASGSTTSTYTAEVKDQNDAPMSGENIAWSLLSPVSGVSIASTTGILTVSSGTTATSCTIVATSESNSSKSGQLQITLTLSPFVPVVTSIEIISGDTSISVPASGSATSTYTAVVKDQNGDAMSGEDVTWSVADEVYGVTIFSLDSTSAELTVSSSTTAESCTVVATSVSNSSKLGQLQVTLAPFIAVADSIVITGPAKLSIAPAGTEITAVYLAEVKDQNGNPMQGETVNWSINNPPAGVSIDPAAGILTVTDSAGVGEVTLMAQTGNEKSAEITVSLLPAWQYLGEGISGALLAGSDLALAVDPYGKVFTAYTEDTDAKVVMAYLYEGTWLPGGPDSSYPGKGPLDLTEDLTGGCSSYLLGWWDEFGSGSTQQQIVVMQGSQDGSQFYWNNVGSGVEKDNVAALSVGKVQDYPFMTYLYNEEIQAKACIDYVWTDISVSGGSGVSELKLEGEYEAYDQPVFMAYRDLEGIKVMQVLYDYNQGWNWQSCSGAIAGTGLSLDVANGIPYVAFRDSQGYAQVSKYDSTSQEWIKMGDKVSPGGANNLSLCVAPNGTPYLAFADGTRDGKASVAQYVYEDGTFKWRPLGAGLSPGAAGVPQLDYYGGNLYLAFKDGYADGKATVMSYYVEPAFENNTPVQTYVSGFNGSNDFGMILDSNKSGTIYYVVVEEGAEPPSVEQVKEGKNANGYSALTSGNVELNDPDVPIEVGVDGASCLPYLENGSPYDVYLVIEDQNGFTPQNASRFDVYTNGC